MYGGLEANLSLDRIGCTATPDTEGQVGPSVVSQGPFPTGERQELVSRDVSSHRLLGVNSLFLTTSSHTLVGLRSYLLCYSYSVLWSSVQSCTNLLTWNVVLQERYVPNLMRCAWISVLGDPCKELA